MTYNVIYFTMDAKSGRDDHIGDSAECRMRSAECGNLPKRQAGCRERGTGNRDGQETAAGVGIGNCRSSPRRGRLICSLGREPVVNGALYPPPSLFSPIGASEAMGSIAPAGAQNKKEKRGSRVPAYPGLAHRGYRSIVPAARVPRRAAVRPCRSTRGYTPSPHWG